jgi:hypothetical protein
VPRIFTISTPRVVASSWRDVLSSMIPSAIASSVAVLISPWEYSPTSSVVAEQPMSCTERSYVNDREIVGDCSMSPIAR